MEQAVRPSLINSPMKGDKSTPKDSVMTTAKDKLSLPNWAVGIMIALLVSLLTSIAIHFEWKGSANEKMSTLEKRLVEVELIRREDRRWVEDKIDYWRAQNQILSNQYAELKGMYSEQSRRR